MQQASNSSNSKTSRPAPRRVVCVETGEVYDGAEAAARALGIAYGGSNIRTAAGNGGMAKGYHWRFEDESAAEPGAVRGNKAVVCWETGEKFDTADAAAAWAGCAPKAIYAAVRLRNTAGDYHWYLADNPRPDASALKFSRKVVCWETGEVFPSAKSAAKSLGLNVANVRGAIKLGSTAGGLHWHYEGEAATAIEKAAVGKSQTHSRVKAAVHPKRRVTCWETGETFESADAAGASIGVKRDAITHAIRKQTRSGGYHWYWNDEPRPKSFEEPKKVRKPQPRRAVACWETGEVFESADAAANAVGIQNSSSVSNAVRKGGTCGGYHWYWADEPKPEGFAPRRRSGGRPKRAVVCWETGEVYSCAQEAAEAVGLKNQSSICAAVRNRTPAGGYRWYYQDEPRPNEAELRNPRALPRAVVCWETGEVYPSITAAASTMGTRDTTYIKRAAMSGEMASGLHWYWADQPKPDASQLRFTKKISRPVACWETGEVFENSAAAAAKVGVNSTNITEAIRKNGRSGGFHWYWADGSKPDEPQLRSAKRSKRAVACWETGETFEDIKAAASFAGVAPHLLSGAIKKKGASGGFHWYWADKPKPVLPELKSEQKQEDGAAKKSAVRDAVVAEKEPDPPQEASPTLANVTPKFGNCVEWAIFFSDVMDEFGRRCKERAGVNATQTRLLLGFALFPNTPVSYIADKLAIKRSTAGCALGELEKKGLVASVEYRRIHPAELTAKGRQRLHVYFEALCGSVDKHLGHLSEPQRSKLLALMGQGNSDWRDALEPWAETFFKRLDNADTVVGERGEIDSIVSSSLAFESMCSFIVHERDHARSLGVPPSEMRALHLLATCRRPMKTAELCERARLDNNFGAGSFPTLLKRGLVVCSKRKSDKRVTDVILADAGRELVEQTADGYVELFEAALPGMSSVSPESFGIALGK